MAIKRIKVSNFKSFKELDIELGNFNVVIGANASGKSNFTQIFKFLRDIEENGLNDAIGINGGLESLRNLKVRSSSPLIMRIVSAKTMGWGGESRVLSIDEVAYQFDLGFDKTEKGVELKNDELTQKLKLVTLREKEKGLFEESDILWEGKLIIRNVAGKPDFSFEPPEIEDRVKEAKIMPDPSYFPRLFGGKIPSGMLLVNTPYTLIPPWETLFKKIAIYNIDPNIAKKPVEIAGKAELKGNGENLALVLNKLIDNKNEKRKFCNLMKDLLLFFEDIDTERSAEKSVMIKLRENYYKDDYLRAYLLSDGTINVTALIIVLYFEGKDTVIVEEPERNIHPHLISRLIDMMKDASKNKQIIVTTHSPQVVKHAGIENILLVSRDKDGFSNISKPSKKKEVKIFLEKDLGLDALYVQDLLAV